MKYLNWIEDAALWFKRRSRLVEMVKAARLQITLDLIAKSDVRMVDRDIELRIRLSDRDYNRPEVQSALLSKAMQAIRSEDLEPKEPKSDVVIVDCTFEFAINYLIRNDNVN